MINDAKRLKRGLKDISPLFSQDQEVKNENRVVLKTAQPVQSLGVFCPEDPTQNSFLSTSLAVRMKTMGCECAMISIKDQKKAALPVISVENDSRLMMPLKRFVLSMEQFEEACRSDSRAAENFGSSVFFLDFDYDNPVQFKKIIPMLDRWVLFLKPELASLTEAFKFIRGSLALNHSLEYFVAYYGPENPQKAATLYERFSDLVSRRIGVGVTWLGCFDGRVPGSISGVSVEALQINSALDSIEKRSLTGFVYPELRLSE